MLFYFVLLVFVEGVVFVHFVLVDFWLVVFFSVFFGGGCFSKGMNLSQTLLFSYSLTYKL